MRRLPVLAAAFGALLLAACVDDRPTAPRAADRAGGAFAGLTEDPALAACDPSGVRSTMGTLFSTSDLKRFGTPTFNLGEQLRQAGDYAGARAAYFAVIDHVIQRFRENRLLTPSQLESTLDGVDYVATTILACAGDTAPDQFRLILGQIASNLTRTDAAPDAPGNWSNYQVCTIVDLAAQYGCVVPSERSAVLIPAHFLTRQALVLMQPDLRGLDPADTYAARYGTTWSTRWRLRVEPADAQTNYALQQQLHADPATPVPVDAVSAGAAFCVAGASPQGFHAPPGALRLAHVAELTNESLLLPRSSNAALFGLLAENCDDHTNDPLHLGSAPFGDSYVGRRTAHVARAALRTVGTLLAPARAHAFDGGAGGDRLLAFSSYFAAVEEPKLHIRGLDPEAGGIDTLDVATRSSTTVHGSRTAYGAIVHPLRGPATAPACTWTSSHRRVSISLGANTAIATLVTGNSAGEATVVAACEDRDEVNAPIVRRDTILVRVVR